MINKEKLLYS